MGLGMEMKRDRVRDRDRGREIAKGRGRLARVLMQKRSDFRKQNSKSTMVIVDVSVFVVYTAELHPHPKEPSWVLCVGLLVCWLVFGAGNKRWFLSLTLS